LPHIVVRSWRTKSVLRRWPCLSLSRRHLQLDS
jgi:hypothetical protein